MNRLKLHLTGTLVLLKKGSKITYMADKKRKKTVLTIVGLVAAVIPFIWIFRRIPLADLGATFSQVLWWTIPQLICITFVTMVLQGFRWWVLIRSFSEELTFFHALSVHFRTLFYSLVLPNSTAHEVVRSVFATKYVGSVISWSAAWVYKITGVFVSLGFSAYGIFMLSGNGLPEGLVPGLILLCSLIVAMMVFSFSKRLTRPFRSIFNRVLPQSAVLFLERLRDGIYQFRERKRVLLVVVAITALIQLLFVTCVTLVILGITGRCYFKECLAFIPLIELVSMAQPFTPNGIGVREAMMAVMFEHLALKPEQLATYVVIVNLSILMKLTGAVPHVVEMVAKKRRSAEQKSAMTI